ncbi:MAG: hypothetical protein LBC20_09135 [Planctomycetaceae bacterium]|jgi:hypothetical protein|nr:hypothetical protein [Planctomycetaceae bacterium]
MKLFQIPAMRDNFVIGNIGLRQLSLLKKQDKEVLPLKVLRLLCLLILFCLFFSGTFSITADIIAAEPVRHKMLLLDESRSQLLYVDQTNSDKNWKLDIENGPAWGIQLIGNNQILVAMPKKGGFREYDLTTRKVVRECFDPVRYAGTMSAVRFPDGRTILGCDRGFVRIFLLDGDGHETAAWEFPAMKIIRQIRRTTRNTLLFGSNSDWCYEVSLEGKIVRELQLLGTKHNYQVTELPNGNWLIAGGYGCFLAEVDRENQVIQRWGGQPFPDGLHYIFMSQFQTLKDGHLVVATWTGHGANDSEKGQQVVEFDSTGHVVWTWHNPQLAGSIHGVIILDDLDTNKFYDDVDFTKDFK